MTQPSSRHLSHDFPVWKGLSLRELSWIVITATPSVATVFTLLGSLLGFPVAAGCLGFIIGFILSITAIPKYVAHLKKDKPYGYVHKRVTQLLVQLKLKPSPWVVYQGQWHKNKTL